MQVEARAPEYWPTGQREHGAVDPADADPPAHVEQVELANPYPGLLEYYRCVP